MNIDDSNKRICLFCLQSVTGSLRCGRCRSALYCSKECQSQHWKVHRNNCSDANNEDTIEKLSAKALNHLNQGILIS